MFERDLSKDTGGDGTQMKDRATRETPRREHNNEKWQPRREHNNEKWQPLGAASRDESTRDGGGGPERRPRDPKYGTRPSPHARALRLARERRLDS